MSKIRKQTKRPFADGLKIKHVRVLILIFILIFAALSFLYLRFAWNRYESIADAEAISLGQSLVSLLHPEHIAELTGSEEDIEQSAYHLAKLSLMRLTDTTNEIRFAYLLGRQGEDILFLLDSEPPESPDYSPPGQIYTEADSRFMEPFQKGITVLANPVTDRWETWISVLVPIKDPSDGRVLAVLGLDRSASEWHHSLWRQMIPDLLIVACMLALIIALLHVWMQHAILKGLSRKISVNEALYRSVFDQLPIGIAIVNDKAFQAQPELGYNSMNPMFEKILGRNSRELEQVPWTEITHPDDLQADLSYFERFKAGESSGYRMEKRFIRPDGSIVWTNMSVSAFLGAHEPYSMHLCLLEDISVRKKTEETLRESERSKSVLLSHLPGMAYRCCYNREWTMEYVSAGCYELTGYPPDNLLSSRDLSFNDVIAPEYRELLWNEWARILPERKPFQFEYEIVTASGARKWVLELGQGIYNEQGGLTALEGIILDVSDRKKIEKDLRYTNEHDRWTGLYNRVYFENLLHKGIAAQTVQNRAIVGVNLSAVYSLASAYGFDYTQDLIKQVADILSLHCNADRALFSTYESLFVFYLSMYKDKEALAAFCIDIAQALEPLLDAERIGAGIGIVEITRDHQEDVDQLLRNLLIASQEALDSFDGTIGCRYFDANMEAQIVREADIKRELALAAADPDQNALFMKYQPIFDLQTNRICGFEALARIRSEKLGLVPPLEFIPIAEKTKLILPIGKMAMRMAFLFLNTLRLNGFDTITVSVNVSVLQLLRDDFSDSLHALLRECEVPPEFVSLEITESVFASNYQDINKLLKELKDAGVQIALDDFGTGYSSLARERDLNINCLKIDKSFIDKLMDLNPDEAITGDVISMAHKLGHCVIAEGVEHAAQLQYLRRFGCDKVQGYLISAPLDEASAISLLRNSR